MALGKLYFSVNDAKSDAAAVRDRLAARVAEKGAREVPAGEADAIVVLGGDGTMLRAVHDFPGKPIVGFNLGGLGYLASVERKDFLPAIDLLLAGRFRLSERTLVTVRKAGEAQSPRHAALNDVVLVREMTGHAASLDLQVDGHAATRYLADGLVIATPTGSTAYSLSAGGPVLMPDAAGLVVTPMNPHALGVRPMVVPDSVRLVVTSRARSAERASKIGVYADGEQVLLLGADESIEVTVAPHGATLIELEGYDPYEVLARKLGWRGSNV
jgi:NAD+ kinase